MVVILFCCCNRRRVGTLGGRGRTFDVCVCRGLGSSIGDSSDGQFGSFVDGLGPGQIVGRQVLGSPCMGEVQLSIADRKGQLEVEVIRARALSAKPGAKVLPGKLPVLFLADR